MADRLARIYGSESDKVNCPFYAKIGACRHGDRCSRLHNKPLFSQSVALLHMYQNPLAHLAALGGGAAGAEQERALQREFEDFYIDVFDEAAKVGEVEELHVCDNLADHLVGNVYVKYATEEDAQRAVTALVGRFYDGRRIVGEFCPVTEFDQARCRQYDERNCGRGGYCNFLHFKAVRRELFEDLISNQPHFGASRRSRDPRRNRSRSRSRERDEDRGDRDRGRDDRREDRGRDDHRRGRDDRYDDERDRR
jgi:splicing factor U2AF subunit